MLLQITAPYFVAGLVIEEGSVKKVAPIIKYMRGYTIKRVRMYCERKGWTITLVGGEYDAQDRR